MITFGRRSHEPPPDTHGGATIDDLWSEPDRRQFAYHRLRSAAQQALEQRFADPANPALADLLDSLVRDVHDARRAWVDAMQEGTQ